MKIEEFYKLIKDILQIDREGDLFPSHLNKLFGAYIVSCEDIDEAYFNNATEKKALISQIEKVCKMIEDCLRLYSSAKLDESIALMREILKHDSFCAYKVKQESIWYRSRLVDGRERVLPAKEMFHVPFELVRKIGNNRFSISGYPCLYLSNTIWACWEEMKEPGLEDFCTSMVKPTKDIDLLDLRFPNNNYNQKIENVLYSLPLIIACSVEVEYPHDPFKPEYVIPQIVMLALVNHERFQGCSFTSTKKVENFDWPDDLLCNIAMPVRSVNEKGLCPNLASCFKISNSINYKYEVLKCNIAPIRAISHNDMLEILEAGPHIEPTAYEDYEGSLFGQMEKLLKENQEVSLLDTTDKKEFDLGCVLE